MDGHLFMPQILTTSEFIHAMGYNDSGRIDKVIKEGENNRLFYGYGGSYHIQYNPESHNFPVWHLVLNSRGNLDTIL